MTEAQPSSLRGTIATVLRRRPGLSAREIAREVTAGAVVAIDKHSVNSCLFSHPDVFYREGTSPPLWYAGADSTVDKFHPRPFAPPPGSPAGRWASSLDLYPWQVRALDGWAAHDHRGVVEAVTGAGKTRLALAAIEAEIRRGGRAVAIVPTIGLQDQWLEEIETHLAKGLGIRANVGAMGGGGLGTLQTAQILVATVQSACQNPLGLTASGGLLVADEVHHYGAERWSAALEDGFDRRLGLTATYERDDDGVEMVLDPYFGTYRYSLDYRGALADNVIAHFKIAFVGVGFGQGELAGYREADDKAKRRRGVLISQYGLTPQPFGVFMREAQRLSKSGGDGAKQAGFYLSAFSKRRQILAAADAKFEYLRDLAPAIKAADSTILFSQTRKAAERAVKVMKAAGVRGKTLHAGLDPSERRETFDAFRDGTNPFIAAPIILDEGVDVPDADLAIVLASSRSRRQMIQRMGRVIRKKADGRLGRVVILYVEGTSEDPQQGAHEDFVQFVLEAADDVQVFDSGRAPTEVVAYLSDW
jgi:superfamily II DNA or RNA helicase